MKLMKTLGVALSAGVVLTLSPAQAAGTKKLHVVSETTVTGFAFPESVAYDRAAKALYVSEFGSELKPTQKDGKGRISKVALDGKVIEAQFLPGAGGEPLNKPKGLWVHGNRLWVTDIDVVWVFDLRTKKGRKVALPGIQFANDPTVKGGTLYVSDNRGDALFSVRPADFLNAKKAPAVKVVFRDKGVNPNGVYPAKNGALLMVGFKSADKPRGIYALSGKAKIKTLAKDLGRLDGVYELRDRTLLVTDWNSGALAHWSAKGGMQTLASGFKGPADFCVVPGKQGMLVVVPDLVKGELRFVKLGY